MPETLNPVLGVDVGGVLMERMNDDADTSFFGANYLLTTAVADAFASLKLLSSRGYRTYLVSKCGRATEEKTRHWLQYHEFFEQTGIPPENVRFCRKRQEKAQICADLGATYFIDDRLEVLSYLTDVPYLYLFNPDESELRQFVSILPRVTRVSSWKQVTALLLEHLDMQRLADR